MGAHSASGAAPSAPACTHTGPSALEAATYSHSTLQKPLRLAQHVFLSLIIGPEVGFGEAATWVLKFGLRSTHAWTAVAKREIRRFLVVCLLHGLRGASLFGSIYFRQFPTALLRPSVSVVDSALRFLHALCWNLVWRLCWPGSYGPYCA